MIRYKDAAPKHADSLVWKAQGQKITANGTCLTIVQTGESEMAEAIHHHRDPTRFPAAYTGSSVINRLVFLSKHRAVSQEVSEVGSGYATHFIHTLLPQMNPVKK